MAGALEERRARAALARLMEPSDWVGLALVAALGPVDALRVATGSIGPGQELEGELRRVLERYERRSRVEIAWI